MGGVKTARLNLNTGASAPTRPRAGDLWEEAPPDPAATIESLRHLGYEPRSALADLIDNSIAWKARHIAVRGHWAGKDSWCAVIDDGTGMTQERLSKAMRIGSADPLVPRESSDLGRFGFGLKTASFSQAREVSVLTRARTGGASAFRCWDLDEVRRSGRWLLRRTPPTGAAPVLAKLDKGARGTIVLWRRLTDLVQPDAATDDAEAKGLFNQELDTITKWLGMVFGRFLSPPSSVDLKVNRTAVKPFDPFLATHPATQALPEDRIKFRGLEIRVEPFVLPHQAKLTPQEAALAEGPLGWNRHQGFYVYRRDRLIVAGDWLGLPRLSRDDAHNLARIAIDVPAELDEAWQLDVSKATVRPPAPLKADLLRIARDTRKRAKAASRHSGGQVRRDRAGRIEHVWTLTARNGVREPTINRAHPLVAKLLGEAGPRRAEVSLLLSLIEEALPAPLLEAKSDQRPPLEDRAPDELLALAESAYESLLRQGRSRREAAQRIRNTEPFNLFPAILERFGGDDA